jgi:hypothetical protein
MLAQLGVRRVRSTKVANPPDQIRETVLEFATNTDPGIATIKGFAAACGKVDSQDDHTMWADVQGRPTALVVVGRLLIAMEFETPSLDRAAQWAVVQKAQNAVGQIQ